jgi:thymidine phosphorylase
VDAEALGRAAMTLGAGRARKGDRVDPAVGVEFFPKIGDREDEGALVGRIHARTGDAASGAAEGLLAAAVWSDAPVEPPPLVRRWVGATP